MIDFHFRSFINVKMKGDEREVSLYGKLIPEIRTFLISRDAIDLLPHFVSSPFNAWDEKDKVLIMENIKVPFHWSCIAILDYDYMI